MEYNIINKTSPNKMSRKGWKPDMIVSHITEGSYSGAVSWLMNPKSGASSHFVVSKKGEITQLVDIREAAWINGTSVKIADSNHYSKSALQLVRDRKTNANYYTIGIEHEGFFREQKGALTSEQLKATIWLHKYIIAEVKKIFGIDIPIDRQHIVGHYQVDPIRKPNCPGVNFQFDEIIKALKGVENMNKPTIPSQMPIKDIPSSWAKEAWEFAKKEKLLDGTRPFDNLTRQEFATVLYRFMKLVK